MNPLNQSPDSSGSRKYQGFVYRLGSKGNYVKNTPAISPINGKIVCLSIGASTPDQIAKEFALLTGEDKVFDVVVGNVWGKGIDNWMNPADPVWTNVTSKLSAEGFTANDVQMVWTMQDDLKNNFDTFPNCADLLYDKYLKLFATLYAKFPNLKHVEISGRPCGYSLAEAHNINQTWYSGWACSWLVQDYRSGGIELQFRISDGCYFWTDGDIVRQDGYYQISSFYRADGIHLEPAGITYNGLFLYRYFQRNHHYLGLPVK